MSYEAMKKLFILFKNIIKAFELTFFFNSKFPKSGDKFCD